MNENGKTLGGHAVQNWCLLRLLPLLVSSKIQDSNDEVWAAICLLREIVALVCAPRISVAQVAYLRVKIEEYLETRASLFPETPLRRKHHYLTHYPLHILQFGPLMRVWTLRFESKHSYFKKCAQHSQNFINVCHTFAERHQLLQAYFSNGSLFESSVCFHDSMAFNIELYNDCVKNAFQKHHGLHCSEVITSLCSTIHGTKYKKDDYVAIEFTQTHIVFGKIVLLFQHTLTNDVCFLVKRVQAQYNSELGLYELMLSHGQDFYECVAFSALKSHCSFHFYTIGNKRVIVLKYALLDE